MKGRSDYEERIEESVESRRQVRRAELILEVTEALCEAIDRRGITRGELARALGRSPAFISQLLAGGRNLTLKTISDLADAIGGTCKVRFEPLARDTTREREVRRWPKALDTWSGDNTVPNNSEIAIEGDIGERVA